MRLHTLRGSWNGSALFCLVLSASLAFAHDQNPSDIQNLVEQLGAKEAAQRELAQHKLEKLGPSALATLRTLMEQSKDEEVKSRIQAVLPKLEIQKTLQVTRINLDAKEKTIGEILEQLGKLARVKMEYNGGVTQLPGGQSFDPKNQLISLSIKDAPFWDAIQQLCDRTGLVYQEGWYGNGDMTMRFSQGDSGGMLACHEGPFRVSIQSINSNKQISFNRMSRGDGSPIIQSESLSASFSVTVEPRLPMVSLGQPAITLAEDDAGQSMLFPAQQHRAYYHGGYYRSLSMQFNLQLRPGRVSRKIKVLEGSIPVTLIVESKPKITINDLLKVKKAEFKEGSTTIYINEVTNNNNMCMINMKISETPDRKKSNPNDYNWLNSVQQRLEVFDDKGNKLQNYGGSWSNSTNTSMEGQFQFGSGTGVPARLLYTDWTTMTHNVPFRFQDIPLP